MRYLVRERLFSISDDFWVTDERGDKIFLVDGKALRLRETFELKDASGAILATIRKRFLSFTDTLDIEHDGEVVATVHRAIFSLLHHRAYIDIPGRGRLEAVGNIIDKDFEIRDGDQVVAQISRAWFHVRDTYGVDIAPGENDVLILASTVVIDLCCHADRKGSN